MRQGAKEYEAQVRHMLLNVTRWRMEHPQADPQITFASPQQTFLIGTISQALRNRWVLANEDGIQLLQALWPWDVSTEPTMYMCRVVLEYAWHRIVSEGVDTAGRELPSQSCPACGIKLDSATCVSGHVSRPKAGDLSICIGCGEPLEYQADMTVSRAPLAALGELDANARYAIETAQRFIRERKNL